MRKRLIFISIALFSIVVWVWLVFGGGYGAIGNVMLDVIIFLGDPGEPDAYRDLTWSPDGEYIAVGGDTGLYIFDSTTLDNYRVYELYINQVVWASDNILVANNGNSIHIFTGDQFSVQTSFSAETLPDWDWENSFRFNVIEWDRSQAVLAAGLSNGNIQLFSIEADDIDHLTIEPFMTLEGHTNFITSLDWNADGTMLFSTSRDNTIRVWDVVTGQLVYSLSVADVLDNETIGLGYNDDYFVNYQLENVYVRDTSTGVERSRISMDWNISTIALSPIDDRLAIVDQGEVNIWDAISFRHLLSLDSASTGHIAWSPDGQRIAGIGYDRNQRLLIIWDAATGDIIEKYSEND